MYPDVEIFRTAWFAVLHDCKAATDVEHSTEVISGQDQGRGVRDAPLICTDRANTKKHANRSSTLAPEEQGVRGAQRIVHRKRDRSLLAKQTGVGAMINFRSVCDSSMAVDRVVGRERDCSHERLS